MLIVVLVLTGGVIAFIGDRLGSKVGKKKLSLLGIQTAITGGIKEFCPIAPAKVIKV